MKKMMILCIATVSGMALFAQQKDSTRSSGINGLFKKANSVLNGSKTGSSLSSNEIVAGLKEALSLGAGNSTGKLSQTDGFLKDAVVKILMPEEVRRLETRMRVLGMGKIVDDAVTSVNRAAEDASKSAGPIFIDAIKKMSIKDALEILRGTDTAATSYLKNTTSNELTNAFRPVIESALKKTDATKYWKGVFTVYNRFSSTPVTADINEYVTERALRGIFHYVGEEEKKIRTNPAARVNDILKKVFGSR
ncbi:MAG: DUF4197 domain-containing protein [Chitinophagaceae bacterium]